MAENIRAQKKNLVGDGPCPLKKYVHLSHTFTFPMLDGRQRVKKRKDKDPESVKTRDFRFKCRLLLVRLVDCTVNLSDFYSYRLVGKLTLFCSFRSSVSAIELGVIVLRLSSRGVLFDTEIEV